jgi:hypothetical protein
MTYLIEAQRLIPMLEISLCPVIRCGEKIETSFLSHAKIFFDDLIDVQPYKDQIVVDLGAGIMPYGLKISESLGAKGYIAVEPNFPNSLRENIYSHSIPFTIIPEDMLTFLRRLPDESVSILTSGIDECILQSKEYITSVEEEIERTLHQLGTYINYCSLFKPKGLKRISEDMNEI